MLLHSSDQTGKSSVRILIMLFLIALLLPFAFTGWKDIYSQFLEKTAPVISLSDVPRGIGLLPVVLRFSVSDELAGLDEVVVRAQQRGVVTDLLKEKLSGVRSRSFELSFDGERSGLSEGEVVLDIRAFDRSFWSNRAEERLSLSVDFKKPSLEVITSQHNARVGGSQLIIYRARDAQLALSGVKLGSRVFLGYPARDIDPDLEDRSLFMALYAVPFDSENDRPRLFAEDRAGNADSEPFYNKSLTRRLGNSSFRIPFSFVQNDIWPIVSKSKDRLSRFLDPGRGAPAITFERPETPEQGVQIVSVAFRELRALDELQLKGALDPPRTDFYWDGAFLPQSAIVRRGFGEMIEFFVQDLPAQKILHLGYFYAQRTGEPNVIASNGGIVVYAGELGSYGNVVAIDHGLGLSSVYAYLGSVRVKAGTEVSAGDRIGSYGVSGAFPGSEILFQIRVHGVPVDPTEWLSRSWYYTHVNSKILDAKKSLGIPIYPGI